MIDLHNLPSLCLLWRAAPNVLLSLGGSAQSPLLQFGRDDLRAVGASLMSLLAAQRSEATGAQATAMATADEIGKGSALLPE
jgi:broad specificity phosphatase PhoE